MPIDYLKKIHLREFDYDSYRFDPSSENASIIEGFYVFHKDTKENSHLIFNDGFPVLVFLQNLNDSVVVKDGSAAFNIKSAWASAGPVKNVHVKYHGNMDQLLVVRFFPGAFSKSFNLDHHYFKNFPVAPFYSICRGSFFSIDDFYALPSVCQRISYLNGYVAKSFKAQSGYEKFDSLLGYIQKIKGNCSVQNLAALLGVNYKWMERSFIQNTGILPKDYIKLQRFFNAYVKLTATDNDLMEIALSNGYYDANHFLKDFKAFTGRSPSQYFKPSIMA
ncbi:AraC family transcriptional regulator [Pedobacter sp. G11]|uniref:helix-turn-helix domain-containing protein n=1 Tax=Pedobacter sp. G11 TaxID=2482728 RepID=UPI000F5FCCDE|nr:helix-turn-helix domain-containing protein [Pedobacter sp. G11]AZI26425.1 AraC family transcriptional regulator [Pedobacter sp. G11]